MARLTEKQLRERLEAIEAKRDEEFTQAIKDVCKKYNRRLNPITQLEVKRV